MKKEVNLAFLAMTVFISIAIICEAQPPDSLPDELMATKPAYIPPVSTGEVIANFEDGQTITNQDIVSTFGYGPQVDQAQGMQTGAYPYPRNQIKLWAYYNTRWTQSPTSINLNSKMNTIFYTDQTQRTWIYEYYPNGYKTQRYWGYRGPGFVSFKFIGDTPGWHLIGIYGEKSGWSNVLQIYVQDAPDFAWDCFINCMASIAATNTNIDNDADVIVSALAGHNGPCWSSCIKCSTTVAPLYSPDCYVCDFCLSTFVGYTIGYSGVCAWECFKNRHPGGYNSEANLNKRPSSCLSCSG